MTVYMRVTNVQLPSHSTHTFSLLAFIYTISVSRKVLSDFFHLVNSYNFTQLYSDTTFSRTLACPDRRVPSSGHACLSQDHNQ